MEKEGKKRCAVSFTGGKDCNLALLRSQDIYEVVLLVCFHPPLKDGEAIPKFRAHPVGFQKAQAEALELPLVLAPVDASKFGNDFKAAYVTAVEKLCADHKIDVIVTGDIDLVGNSAHNFMTEVCAAAACRVTCGLPLWNVDRASLLEEMIASGLEMVFSCVKSPFFDETWIGRVLDEDAVEEMKQIPNLDLCGENGEYHTMVVYNPLRKKRVTISSPTSLFEELHNFPGQAAEEKWWVFSDDVEIRVRPSVGTSIED